MSVCDKDIEVPTGEPLHEESESCRCADCVAERIDNVADMEISQ